MADPVFILYPVRSGSTLLRRILNAHDDIWCPDETKFPSLVSQLLFFVQGVLEQSTLSDDVLRDARSHLDRIIDSALQARGKKIFCDKSDARRYVPRLQRVYPEAKFICLTRQVTTCVQSILRTFNSVHMQLPPWCDGDGPMTARRPPHRAALYWASVTELQLKRLEESPQLTHHIRYEQLVAEPESTINDLLQFLGVADAPGLIERSFEQSHFQRPLSGDWHVKMTSQVEKRPEQSASEMPWLKQLERSCPETWKRIDAISRRAGYPSLDECLDQDHVPDADSEAYAEVYSLVGAALEVEAPRFVGKVQLTVGSDISLLVESDDSTSNVRAYEPSERVLATLKLSHEVFSELKDGDLDAHHAMYENRLLTTGDNNAALELLRVMRIGSDLT